MRMRRQVALLARRYYSKDDVGRPHAAKKRPAPDAEQPPVKMRKQRGYVFFQSQHREAASAAVDIDPDTNTLGARERNQAVMRKLAEMWGARDDGQAKWSDDRAARAGEGRKPKAKVVKEAKPAAKAKEASPRKARGASIPSRRRRRSAGGPAAGRRRRAPSGKAAPVPEPGVLESEPESEEEEAEAAPAAAPARRARPPPSRLPSRRRSRRRRSPSRRQSSRRRRRSRPRARRRRQRRPRRPAPAAAPAAAPVAAPAVEERARRRRASGSATPWTSRRARSRASTRPAARARSRR